MRIVLLGDVVGEPGRAALAALLPVLRRERSVDFVVANGENSAGGAGVTPKTFEAIVAAGVDVVTSGNHIYRQREVIPLLESAGDRLLRPANYSPRAAGRGSTIRTDARGRRVAVLNLQGRVFMDPVDDPFDLADRLVPELRSKADFVLVDFHGEATSEKKAMGRFLDGRASVVVGTHTHVQTADETILPGGTAYLTDLGMTGPHDSCLGVETAIVLRKFLTGMPTRFEVAKDDARMQGLFVELDDSTGRAIIVERIDRCL